MAARTVTIYEVSNGYVTQGTNTSILSIGHMTINDTDGTLDASLGADPGGDQTITTTFGNATNYSFFYNDTTAIGGVTQTIKTFQLTIGGVTRSFVMNDTQAQIPGVSVGDSVQLQNYTNYTPITYNSIACFAAGTEIETVCGMRPVETLAVGDSIITRDHGPQAIRWAGCSVLSHRDLLARPHLAPIVIEKGALGPDQPSRKLRLSPQHRILLQGWDLQLTLGVEEGLAPAKFLLGRPGIYRDTGCRRVSYHHILFDHHEVINSNGQWSESFLLGETIRTGMDHAQTTELQELFPDLRAFESLAHGSPARMILHRHEVSVLDKLAA